MSDIDEPSPATSHPPPNAENSTQVTQQTSAPRSGLPPFSPFDPIGDPSAVGQRWKKWVRRFENLLISLREFDSTIRRGLLLTYVGEATNDIFDILPGNKDVAIFEFRELAQGNDENITDYYRRLKTKAADCGFTNEDSEIKTQIIHRTRDARLRKKALREEMDLKALLKFGQSLEITDKQVKRLENSTNSVNSVKNNRQHVQYRNKYGNNRWGRFLQNTEKQQDSKKTCRNCGGAFPHKNGVQSCPAHGKECHNCGKTGHFSKFCRSANQSKTSERSNSLRINICKILMMIIVSRFHPPQLNHPKPKF